jgi:hypothetical protein
MKSKIMEKIFGNGGLDPIDKGIAELLAFDRPLEKAHAALQRAESSYKERVTARLMMAGELMEPPELGFDLAELARQARLIEEAFSEKRGEVAKLLGAGAVQLRKQRLSEIKDAIETIARERHIVFMKACLHFARMYAIDLREIRFPTRHTGGVMPLPAPVLIEPDTGELDRLRTEALSTAQPPQLKYEELVSLRMEEQRLGVMAIQPPEQAIDILLDQARREAAGQ